MRQLFRYTVIYTIYFHEASLACRHGRRALRRDDVMSCIVLPGQNSMLLVYTSFSHLLNEIAAPFTTGIALFAVKIACRRHGGSRRRQAACSRWYGISSRYVTAG